jgi:membrane-associated phospholipid phosphatase/protein-S-isoprenylcysteine O-methyltransferase Ste14
MAVNMRWGKIAYGLLFVLVLPIGLRFWTDRLAVSLPVERDPFLGVTTIAVGVFLAVWGMLDLWFIGRGLPMNAYPPPNPVRRRLYGIVPHPIYVGFVACVVGESIRIGSAAGLWITAPLVALGCLVLVVGFEGPELRKRFGRESLPEPWLGFPRTEGRASLATRVGTLVWTGGIWGLAYLGTKALGVPRLAVETRMPWEWNIPILPFTMMLYASVYAVVPLAFLVESDKKRLRCLSIAALLATCLNTLLYLVLPLTAEFRMTRPEGFLSRWLDWEQRMAIPAAGCFPSFHATWAVLAAWSLGRRRSFSCNSVCALWCVALCASCLTTGMHSVADVVAGAIVGLLAARHEKVWRGILDLAEILGNSWKAWSLGGLRIMNHGIWSGVAGAVGIVVIGSAVGQSLFGWVLVVAATSLIGACLWAQWVEGSAALLRPFGYYGSIFGGLVAIVASGC